jgi:hypothetical protein
MHRSGTSAITSLLLELGVSFSKSEDLYKGDQWNKRGYYEQTDLIDLNNKIITGFNRYGNFLTKLLSRLVFWVFLPNKQKIKCRANRFKSEIECLAKKYASKAVKDTRFCPTLKYWKSVVEIERYVVCLRYPEESVMSLKRRQKFPLWMGYRFWNFNMSALLEELPAARVLYVDYNQLMGDRYFDQLSLIRQFFQIQLSDDEMVQRYKNIFDPDLYNCKVQGKKSLPPETQKLWDKFLNLSQQASREINISSRNK